MVYEREGVTSLLPSTQGELQVATTSNIAYEHKTESQEYRESSNKGELQVVNEREGVTSPLPSTQGGPRCSGVMLVPSSHRHIPLPAEPVAIISGDGEQNGVDEEIVYDVLHGDVDQ